MARAATALFKARKAETSLAPLILMSDPERLPDICAAAQRLPERAAIVYRHFGHHDRLKTVQRLRQITLARGQQLLIGADPVLAIEVGADGVHFKRDEAVALPMIWRARCPDWIITMAGLKNGRAYTGDISCLDGLFVSSVFESISPSAGAPIGVDAFKTLCKALPVPVIALGGIESGNARELIGSGAAGIAGVSGIVD